MSSGREEEQIIDGQQPDSWWVLESLERYSGIVEKWWGRDKNEDIWLVVGYEPYTFWASSLGQVIGY